MARPERKNADYFPFYAKDGRTLFLLESKYGCKGTGFFTNVMRFLTLETDHHVNIQDETDAMYFFSKCHCDVESGMDMLGIMSKTGKINKELWDINVVASQALFDSLADAYRNRKNSIISMKEIKQKYVSDVDNEVSNADNSQGPVVSDVGKPQRKGKETKGKETKGKKDSSELKNISEQQSPLIISIPLIDKTEYPIYQTDISEWEDAFPAIDVIKILKRIRLWNIDKPKRRKTKSGIRAHITTWLEKEQNKGEGQQQSKHDSITDHNMRVVGKFLQKEGAI